MEAPEEERPPREEWSIDVAEVREVDQKDKTVSAKYVIEARFSVEGVVEKHDVIGAIFGQTEGLFPKEFELRELQKSGKIGRIDIELKSANDRTEGTITIPSSLDRAETAIIAAAVETIDRIGPCEAKVRIERIVDVRADKREKIIQRAKELMRDWVVKDAIELEKLIEEVSKDERRPQPVQYGKERLTATPDISQMDELIIVEGRADVINLLKSGYTGVIALEGVKIPKTIMELTRKKETTVFLDGDRGGDLILKELMQVARPKYVARAPRGKEVEELTPEEIREALAKRVPFEKVLALSRIGELAGEIRGTLEAILMRGDGAELARIPVSELVDRLRERDDVEMVVFDGIITQRLLETAKEKGVKTLVGERVATGVEVPPEIEVKLFSELP
ncbi:DNA primase [Candidatus Bathyarchaeota archaeon]|nr:DNA primase [Candidatus Bathyarchaeota archaeon]